MQYTCPKCGAIGAGEDGARYFCHVCPTYEIMLPSNNGEIHSQFDRLGKLKEGWVALTPTEVQILRDAYPNIKGASPEYMKRFREILGIPDGTSYKDIMTKAKAQG